MKILSKFSNKKTKTQSDYAVLGDAANGFALLSKYRRPIMGLSALWILAFHFWIYVAEAGTKASEIEQFIKVIGFCGVDIFLMLSGIGLTYSIKKTGLGGFYYNRIKRVFLPLFIIGVYRAVTEEWPLDMFFKNVFFINFYTYFMYSFLWFGTAIMTLYLAFPLYHKIFQKNPTLVTVIALELWLLLTVYFRDTMRNDLFGFTNRIPIFVIGVYFGWLTQNKKVKFTIPMWCMIGLSSVLGLYFAYLSNFLGYEFIVPVSNCCIPNMLIAISLPFLIAKLIDILLKVKYVKYIGIALVKFLSFYGLFSLELYCVQELISPKVLEKLGPECPPMRANVALLAASTAFGLLLYLVVKYFWKLVDFLIGKIKTSLKSGEK